MFDFPNSPSVGQRVTGVGGIVYAWDGVKWTNSVGGVTVQSMGDVGRNLIHNPLFNIAQRGAGPFTTTLTYTIDRWRLDLSNDTVTVASYAASDAVRSQVGDEAVRFALAVGVTGNVAAGAFTCLVQPIEDVRRLAGKTIAVSFYASVNNGTAKLGISLDQAFGTGGSAEVDVNGQSVTLTTTWTRYSLVFAIPSIVGKTVGTANDNTALRFWFSSGTTFATRSGNVGVQTAAFNLWGVQLEIGNVATPLEKPELRYDLSNCQRFYHTNIVSMIGTVSGVAAYGYYLPFPVAMRAIPTVTPGTLTTALNVTGGLIADSFTAFGTRFYCNSTATGVIQFSGTYTASADL